MTKGLPSMHKVLGLSPITEQKKKKKGGESVIALEWILFYNYQKGEFSTKTSTFHDPTSFY